MIRPISTVSITSSPSSPRRVRASGFTLLEVALGIMVMAVVFAGVMSAAVQIRKLAVISQATARANTVLNSTVEELRALSFEQLETRFGTPANLGGTLAATSVAGFYPITWQVTPEALNDDYYRVTVTVSWAIEDHPYNLAAVTDFYRNGINKR